MVVLTNTTDIYVDSLVN